ncbi:uracil-DNA glycosylase, partial [Halorubrum sp. CBA1125]|uniref:uracil-DNA glycosylase family protein n=1 Tax=Halorubrum sp. CBA1125 TaxID=2668072 RepID=UPI0012E89E08
GEAPAAGDPDAERWRGGNRTGRAYTSRHSGRRIRRLVADCGYADRAYFTNAVKCYPRDETADRETNREPTAAERRRCRDHLRAEVETVDPAVVCPTGRHATVSTLALTDRSLEDVANGFLDAVLDPVAVPMAGAERVVLPLLHPSYRDVWAPRLGYDDGDAYREAVERALDGVTYVDGRPTR